VVEARLSYSLIDYGIYWQQCSITSVPKAFRETFCEGNLRRKQKGANLTSHDYVRKRLGVTQHLLDLNRGLGLPPVRDCGLVTQGDFGGVR